MRRSQQTQQDRKRSGQNLKLICVSVLVWEGACDVDIFKIIGIGLIAAVTAVIIKPNKPEIAIQISLAAGILIFIGIAGELTNALSVFNSISDKLGSDKAFISVVLKVIGIAYAAEFACNICKDMGESGIATKIDIAGKVLIFVLCAPLIKALLDIISSIV